MADVLGVVVDRRLASELRALGLGALIESTARRNGLALPPRVREFIDEVSTLAVSSPPVEFEAAEPIEWMSTAEAAAILGIDDRRVRRMIERQDLVGRKLSGSWQVTAESVADARIA